MLFYCAKCLNSSYNIIISFTLYSFPKVETKLKIYCYLYFRCFPLDPWKLEWFEIFHEKTFLKSVNSWIYFCLFLSLNVWHTSLIIQNDAASGLVKLLIAESKGKKQTSLFKLKVPQFGSFNESILWLKFYYKLYGLWVIYAFNLP